MCSDAVSMSQSVQTFNTTVPASPRNWATLNLVVLNCSKKQFRTVLSLEELKNALDNVSEIPAKDNVK